MSDYVIAWDLETILDLDAFRRIEGLPDLSAEQVVERAGDEFPKLPLHEIVCIGAVVAKRVPEGWSVVAVGAPHSGERPEREIVEAFVAKIEELRPQLVTFNGHGFDLPVLRYRAMLHSLPAAGLNCRGYFNRYSNDCLDLCDALSSFDGRGKMKLDALCRFLGLAGKPEGIDGSEVAEFVRQGRIQEVADYCETDVLNTYRLFLRYELFRSNIDAAQYAFSEAQVRDVIASRAASNPYLRSMLEANT